MVFDLLTAAEGVIVGIIATGLALYGYIKSRITVAEAQQIYTQAKAVVTEYNAAKATGTLTSDEKLKLAEEALATLMTVVKDLEA